MEKKINLRLVASTKCKIALVETALCLAHADDQMLHVFKILHLTKTIKIMWKLSLQNNRL